MTSLPIVATVGANAITGTTVNLIGSVNTQSETGTAWFAWGPTSSLGNQTAAQPVAASSVPQTFSIALTRLTAGVTYYFAAVSETGGGTVTATALTVTPVAASGPSTASTTPQAAIPHFAYPFTLTNTGVVTVQQDTLEEVEACVQMIVNCPLNACPELPTFGIPDPTGSQPVSASQIVAAVQRWEPRATETAVVQAINQVAGEWGISLTTSLS